MRWFDFFTSNVFHSQPVISLWMLNETFEFTEMFKMCVKIALGNFVGLLEVGPFKLMEDIT